MKIENEFIPYEQALALKELGFDKKCLLQVQYSFGSDIFTGQKYENSIWLCNGGDAEIGDEPIKYKFPKHSEQEYGVLEIPTFSQVFRFFREKYEYCNFIKFSNNWFCSGFEDRGYNEYGFGNYSTYEEAELECLKKLIEIVKTK